MNGQIEGGERGSSKNDRDPRLLGDSEGGIEDKTITETNSHETRMHNKPEPTITNNTLPRPHSWANQTPDFFLLLLLPPCPRRQPPRLSRLPRAPREVWVAWARKRRVALVIWPQRPRAKREEERDVVDEEEAATGIDRGWIRPRKRDEGSPFHSSRDERGSG